MQAIIQRRVKNIDEFEKYVHYEGRGESEVPEEVYEGEFVFEDPFFGDQQIWKLSNQQGDFLSVIPERTTSTEFVEIVENTNEMSPADIEFGELVEYFESYI